MNQNLLYLLMNEITKNISININHKTYESLLTT